MKQYLLILFLWPFFIKAQHPTLSLNSAYEMARKNYPSIKQLNLLQQTANINIDNLNKAFLPQVNFSGQVSYQSDVTKVNIPIPNVSIPTMSKDQYKIFADISQLVYDGGGVAAQKKLQELNQNTEQEKIDVELYQLRDRINQVYLGIILLDEQIKQTDLMKSDLNTGLKTTNAQIKNGVSLKSNADIFKAEILKTEQQKIELQYNRKGLIDVLGLFINQQLPEDLKLERPIYEKINFGNNQIQRPELKLYDAQVKLFDAQNQILDARIKPKASLFLQTGYGRPGLNMLNNDFALFYIGGLRLNWSLGDFYTRKNNKQLIDINKKSVEYQKETFLLNTNASLRQKKNDIEKFQALATKDAEIIELREKVKMAANAQLENGVITANDYLKNINAEDQARQSLILHQIQLYQATINYQTILGKQ